jgi:putative DNA methylase
MLSSGKANQTRLKTASESGSRLLGEGGFSASLVRNDDAQTGKNWLRNEVRDYWNQRKNLIAILRYLATMGIKTLHRGNDAEAARLLAGAVENDSV